MYTLYIIISQQIIWQFVCNSHSCCVSCGSTIKTRLKCKTTTTVTINIKLVNSFHSKAILQLILHVHVYTGNKNIPCNQ